MAKLSQETIQQLEEFNQKGYTRSHHSSKHILNVLRLDPNMRTFRVTLSNESGGLGGTKYSCRDFFGENIVRFLYDMQRTDSFVEHLYSLFYDKNPKPSVPLRRAFTKLLSSNYLIPKDYNRFRK